MGLKFYDNFIVGLNNIVQPTYDNFEKNTREPFSASGGNIDALAPGNGYVYHVFTSPGSFIVSGDSKSMEILVVGGGGGGGSSGGGGGAGGVVHAPSHTVSVGTYPITVGTGGDGANSSIPNYGSSPRNGNPSSFGSLFIATGGGAGSSMDEVFPGPAGDSGPPFQGHGQDGGSGGGAGRHYLNGTQPGGLAVNPNPNPGATEYGNIGGTANPADGQNQQNGGGGGAGGAGSPGPSNYGVGGDGYPFPAFGAPLLPGLPAPWASEVGPTGLYGGGGGGGKGRPSLPTTPTPGGTGGGGDGGVGSASYPPGYAGTPGVTNTGGGGGGGGSGPGQNSNGNPGGPGIVIIRYLA